MPRVQPRRSDTPDKAVSLEAPSKSELKRRMHELQVLGHALTDLPEERLARTEMPDALREAIAQYKHTRSHEGRRRQLQYLGKLMRRCDPEPLRQAVAEFQLGGARDALQLHRAEAWREQLVAGDDALTRWAQTYPQSDLQQLRSLVRSARAELKHEPTLASTRHGRAWRELFKTIRPWVQDHES